MKIQLRTRSLGKMVIGAFVAASLNIAVHAQPAPDKNASAPEYSERLENLITNTEKSVIYTAPDMYVLHTEAEAALQNLDILAGKFESGLKYKPPVEIVDPSVQHLELLAENMMTDVLYRAPSEKVMMNQLAEENSLPVLKRKNQPVKVEIYSSRDQWLINAGYYKSLRTPAWEKLKRMVNHKSEASQFADGF